MNSTLFQFFFIPHKEHIVYVIETNRLMLHKEIIFIYLLCLLPETHDYTVWASCAIFYILNLIVNVVSAGIKNKSNVVAPLVPTMYVIIYLRCLIFTFVL